MNVTDTIKGALVALTFRLKHYYIQDKKYDTFSATIEQIIVLKRAPPQQPSPYRHGAGPVRLPTTGPTRSEQVAAVSAFYPPVPAASTPAQMIQTHAVAIAPMQAVTSQAIPEPRPKTDTPTANKDPGMDTVGSLLERNLIPEQVPGSPLQSTLPIRGSTDSFTPWPPTTPPRCSEGSSTASSEPNSEFATPQMPKTPSPSGTTQQVTRPQNAAAGPSNLRSGHTVVNESKRKESPGGEDGNNLKKGKTGV